MALEVVADIENDLGMVVLSSYEEVSVSGRELDSGHWSEEYVLQDDLRDNTTCDVKEKEEDTTKPTDIGENRIPTPPPWPPIKGEIKRDKSIQLDTELQIPQAPPPPPIKASAAKVEATPPKEVDESQCCIVCFDPNEVTEYNDFDYHFYIEVHRVVNSHLSLPCCRRFVCKSCIEGIISTVVGEGRVQISCPHPECGKPFTKDYILSNITDATVKSKFQQFLVDIEDNGRQKTCPKCCHITEHELPKRFRLREADLKIECKVCQHEWCFRCHAPWHKDISCRQFQKGSKQFQKWTKDKVRGVANCQKCPTCRVFIQRSTGCNHMQCNRCNTDFCYDCGGRYLELGIMDHDSTLNVWGCPDNYSPDNAFIRNTVRWGYLSGKLSYLVAYPPLLVGACGLVILGGAVVLPIYAGFKLHSYRKYRRQNNRRRR